MTVLIVAASKSDVEVLRKAVDELYNSKVPYEFRVCSAHRTPEMLDSIMAEKKYEVIIAAAGLAAALPGVVAAKTTAPVIGVPLAGAFEGLDALMSIIQMPPGIPVLTTGVNNAEEAGKAAIKILGCEAEKVNIIAIRNKSQKAVDKATELLKMFEIQYELGQTERKDAVNIFFVDINEKKILPQTTTALTIYCPTSGKDSSTDAQKLLELTRKGLWVGLNRGENAAVAAAEIMRKKQELSDYREIMRQNVEEADSEVHGKL